jgi:hypothetical protein
MIAALIAAYVIICAALAYIGRTTRVGPLIIFLLGIFITPIVPAIYVLVTRIEMKS